MAPKKAATRTPRKRTAHVDDPSKPGTSINVETALLIAKGDTIREFCEEKSEVKRRTSKITDAFSKSVEKKPHLHRQAANDAHRLSTMEPEELHAYLYHFLFYVKDLGLLEKAKKQEEMFAAGETGPGIAPKDGAHQDDHSGQDDHEDETAQDSSAAASRIGAAARAVAEQAGARLHQDT